MAGRGYCRLLCMPMLGKLDALKSDRDFQVWEYLVSHGQLLIRSPGFKRTNVDIEFFAVEYVSLPHYLKGIEILEPTAEEDESFRQLVGRLLHKNVKVHVLKSGGKRHYVVGILRGMFENDWEPFESPLYGHHYYHGLEYPFGKRTVNIWVSEPWDWVTQSGGGPFEGYVIAAHDDYLLAKLRRQVWHRGHICKLILAKTINPGDSFRQLESDVIRRRFCH